MKSFTYIIAAFFVITLLAGGSPVLAAEIGAKQAIAAKNPLDTRIQSFAERMANIYSIIVNKLDGQADRISKTITRLDQSTEDVDLTDAKDQLAVARVKIKAAQKAVKSLDATISAILKKGESPRIELKEIRDEISDISDKITDAHNTLQYTIVIIKQEMGLDEEESGISGFSTTTATSTATTTGF